MQEAYEQKAGKEHRAGQEEDEDQTVSADDLIVGKEEPDLGRRSFRCVGTVH